MALKTSPSGGARHAIELYTLAFVSAAFVPGWYHYAADAHALELIDDETSRRLVRRYLPQQPWFEPAAALVFFAAVLDRELWRYPYARAYRALLIEAGHLCQTFCLTATWLGLAPFCTMALADSAIEKDLGLDGIGESVLYAAGVGARLVGVRSPGPKRPGASSALTPNEVRQFPGRIPCAIFSLTVASGFILAPMLQGFKQFLLRGNVIDLAVAVVIGAAFGKVVETPWSKAC